MTSRRAIASSFCGPDTQIQPSLSCGSPADFDKPPRLNVQRARVGARGERHATARRRPVVRRVAGEDLVGDERHAARLQLVPLGAAQVVPGRIVRIDDEDRARRAVDRREVDGPVRLARDAVRREPHAVERGEVPEERIARLGHGDDVARIAQELEEVGVRLARRRADDDVVGRNAHLGADRLAGRAQP